MSTNFYLTTENSVEPIHIGKATNSGGVYGISTWHGAVNHTLEEWKNFILEHGVKLENEYGEIQNKEEFIKTFIDDFVPAVCAYNIGWYHGARYELAVGYNENAKNWVDPRGALFVQGEFF